AILGLMAVLRIARPYDVVNRIYILQERCDAFESISQFRGNWKKINTTALLKISKLRDLQTVEHDLPANSPSAQGWRFPIVFFELNVMLVQINSHRAQRFKIKLLHILRRRFQNDL